MQKKIHLEKYLIKNMDVNQFSYYCNFFYTYGKKGTAGVN